MQVDIYGSYWFLYLPSTFLHKREKSKWVLRGPSPSLSFFSLLQIHYSPLGLAQLHCLAFIWEKKEVLDEEQHRSKPIQNSCLKHTELTWDFSNTDDNDWLHKKIYIWFYSWFQTLLVFNLGWKGIRSSGK